jgi:predicted alpha/beta-hydrolase family hydrolase
MRSSINAFLAGPGCDREYRWKDSAHMSSIETPFGSVSMIADGDAGDLLVVLAHGAGSSMEADFMKHVAIGIAGAGIEVCRFNFAYMEAGRKVPDRQAVLEGTFSAVVEALRSRGSPPKKVVVGGKSMGGRIASHLAAEGADVDGVLFHGYPLHPPGRPDRIRDAHLAQISTPMLFVEGTRDPFCPLDTLASVRRKLPMSSLVVIDDGDHSFKVRKSSGRTTAQAWDEVVKASVDWLRKIA